jgi:CheY-like chemotaxis protein
MERPRVLVVDDSADMRASTKMLLELLGYEVDTAGDGAAALELQRSRAFGVLITDIFMPGTEGMETIAKFKAGWPKVRVIAMSGGGARAKHDYLDAASQIGADATMHKPFSLEMLVTALGFNGER